MYKAAVIGDYDSIYGFSSAGMDIIPVRSDAECAEAFAKILKGGYGVVFVTENYAPAIENLITQPIPAVMFIPSADGKSGYAADELHRMTEKAVGADILS